MNDKIDDKKTLKLAIRIRHFHHSTNHKLFDHFDIHCSQSKCKRCIECITNE